MLNKAQTTIDYVVIFVVIIAVLLIMGHYVRNALSGKIREGADIYGKGEVYAPQSSNIGPTQIKTSTYYNTK
ncbi:hypothetical protein D4R78_03060 [bacterium]|nr:MAG: hypothetical protein D4R78_03060 [bacterium]